jgi:hypothetical protein
MKPFLLANFLTLAAAVGGEAAHANDANYIMAIINNTHSDITVRIEQFSGRDEVSSCIGLADGNLFQKYFVIAPLHSHYIGFWRASGCSGKQGWLAIRASGAELPKHSFSDDDYQQFWFDTKGSFEKHGHNSEYANRLDTYSSERVIGDSVPIAFHIGIR